MKMLRILVTAAMAALLGGCGGGSAGGPGPADFEFAFPSVSPGGGFVSDRYTLTRLECVGALRAYETDNFLVFTDAGVPDAAVELVAAQAEQAFASLQDRFRFTATEWSGAQGVSGKPQICLTLGDAGLVARAYLNGFVITSPSSDVVPDSYRVDGYAGYADVIEHVVTHLMSRRLSGDANGDFLYRWFDEGLSVWTVGEPWFSTGQAFWDFTVANQDPFSAIHYGDIPGDQSLGYYPVYGALVGVLFEPAAHLGANNDPRVVVDLLLEMRQIIESGGYAMPEDVFPTAFELHVQVLGSPLTLVGYSLNYLGYVPGYLDATDIEGVAVGVAGLIQADLQTGGVPITSFTPALNTAPVAADGSFHLGTNGTPDGQYDLYLSTADTVYGPYAITLTGGRTAQQLFDPARWPQAPR